MRLVGEIHWRGPFTLVGQGLARDAPRAGPAFYSLPGGAVMTARWHRTKDLVGLAGMPGERSIRLHGARRGWVSRETRWGSRMILEWDESSLPLETQAALRLARGEEAPESSLPGPAAGGDREAPSAVSLADGGPAAFADARVDILAAFDRWRAPRRVGLVAAMREWAPIYNATGGSVSEETRARIPAVAWNTLQRWRAAYCERGIEGLLNGAGGRTSGIDADPAVRGYVEAQVRHNPNHVTARHIQEGLAARFRDRETPSISTVRRWVRAWRKANGYGLSASADPDGHRNRTMPAFGSESAPIEALNQLWELDSTRLDVMCADGRRYAIVAAIDVWSRRFKVLVTPESRATAIAALLRRCLLDWGVPEWIRTDEGADYTSKHIRRVLGELDIAVDLCPPYRPDKKPFIERAIGRLSHQFLSQLPGFTGHDVADAQKLRARKSFAARRGEGALETFRCELTADELQARLDAWCETVYERRPHNGLDGMTPFERAAGWRGERRTVDERGLDMLLAPAAGSGRRKVGKKGIKLGGRFYVAGALGKHMDAWVHVRQDLTDPARIVVFTAPDDRARIRFICLAEDVLRTGADPKAIAVEAKRLWRERNKDERAHTRELEREHRPDNAVFEVLDKAAEDAGAVVAFPARGAVHSTDAMEEAAKAEEAAQRAAQAERDGIAGKSRSMAAVYAKIYGKGGNP